MESKATEKLIKKLLPDQKTEIKNFQLDFLKEESVNINSDLLKLFIAVLIENQFRKIVVKILGKK